jgi:hypothetical protein
MRNSLGRQTLTVSAAVVQLTVPATARHAILYLEVTNAIRMTADGTDPVALTTGMVIEGGTRLDWFMREHGDFHQILTDLEFIREGGSDATLQAEYFD